MNIYVIYEISNHKIVGFSEHKEDVLQYILVKNLSDEKFKFTKVKKKMAERIMLDFEDLYIEHDEELDMVLTRIEHAIVNDILEEERSRLRTTIADLEHYISNYSYSKKEKSILLKAHKIVSSTRKKKKLKHVIQLDNFVGFLTRSKNIFDMFRERLHTVSEKMMIFITVKDD